MRNLPLKKIFLIFLITTFFSKESSANPPKKEWEIVVVFNGTKLKGTLRNVTDSSVVFEVRKKATDETLFRDIQKIKLRPLHGQAGKRLIGFFTGGIAGAIGVSTALSAGKQGESRALAGVVGGIGGGIVFGITGALLAPQVYNLFGTKKFIIEHTSTYYSELTEKLRRYLR